MRFKKIGASIVLAMFLMMNMVNVFVFAEDVLLPDSFEEIEEYVDNTEDYTNNTNATGINNTNDNSENCIDNLKSFDDLAIEEYYIVRRGEENFCRQTEIIKGCEKEFEDRVVYYKTHDPFGEEGENSDLGEEGENSHLKKIKYYKCVAKLQEKQQKKEEKVQENVDKCVDNGGFPYGKDLQHCCKGVLYATGIIDSPNSTANGLLCERGEKIIFDITNGAGQHTQKLTSDKKSSNFFNMNGEQSKYDFCSDEDHVYKKNEEDGSTRRCCQRTVEGERDSGTATCVNDRKSTKCEEKRNDIVMIYNNMKVLHCLPHTEENILKKKLPHLSDDKIEEFQGADSTELVKPLQLQLKPLVTSYPTRCDDLEDYIEEAANGTLNFDENECDIESWGNAIDEKTCTDAQEFADMFERKNTLGSEIENINEQLGKAKEKDEVAVLTEEYESLLKDYEKIQKKLEGKEEFLSLSIACEYLGVVESIQTCEEIFIAGGDFNKTVQSAKDICEREGGIFDENTIACTVDRPEDSKQLAKKLQKCKKCLACPDGHNAEGECIGSSVSGGGNDENCEEIYLAKEIPNDIEDVDAGPHKKAVYDVLEKNNTVIKIYNENNLQGYENANSKEQINEEGKEEIWKSVLLNSEVSTLKLFLENSAFEESGICSDVDVRDQHIATIRIESEGQLQTGENFDELAIQKYEEAVVDLCNGVNGLDFESIQELGNDAEIKNKKQAIITCIYGTEEEKADFNCDEFTYTIGEEEHTVAITVDNPEARRAYRLYEIEQCLSCQSNTLNGVCCTNGRVVSNQAGTLVCCNDKNISKTTNQCCAHGVTDEGECLTNAYGQMGIKCSTEDLLYGSCSMRTYQLFGIRKEDPDPDPHPFIQDIILAATSFIGTIVTISLIISGFKRVMAGSGTGEVSSAKNGVKYSLIGLALVIFSYVAIRLIQYIAKG